MRSLAVCLVLALPLAAHAQDDDLGVQARKALETHCYRCHGKDGSSKGRFGYVLDVKKMAESKKIVAKKAAESRIYARLIDPDDPMPPEDVKARPSRAEIEIIRKWIEAGATDFAEPDDLPEIKRKPVTLRETFQLMHDHLLAAEQTDSAKYQRFFTLTHLHNNPKVTDPQMRLYRAGLAKILNSLSWRKAIVYPTPLDVQGTILAIDLRDLDWDLNGNWLKVIGAAPDIKGKLPPLTVEPHKGYPYALTHERNPDDAKLNALAKQVYRLAGTEVPALRADWFIAAASLPPLYHELLNLPEYVGDLEQQLKVNVAYNFLRDKLVRAGFGKSNVSSQNRLVERHDATFGMYWKSYDFKGDDGRAVLVRFPLGPLNLFPATRHPYQDQAFVHDGGEMIWALPNGLHAYMLTNGNGKRIDSGPAEVVRDEKETAGRGPAIFNGLSCMACHKHGMIELPRDDIRGALQGKVRDKVRRLYPEKKFMDRLLEDDERDYLTAVDRVIAPYLRVGADKKKDIKQFPEVVSALATPYLKGGVDLDQAALELGLEPAELKAAIKVNGTLRDLLGLRVLSSGGQLKRQTWESVREVYSPFQDAAVELQLGTPVRLRRLLAD